MAFSEEIRNKAFISCGRCCCICHKFCGSKMELHHIIQKANGGKDSFENAIPLCLDCHADVKSYNPEHPKGSMYSEKELRGHRDSWYMKISQPINTINDQKINEVDLEVFLYLNKYLDISKLIWMRDTALGGSFLHDTFYYLREFLEISKIPNFEYLSAELETVKANFAYSIDSLYNAAASCVFCEKGRCSVPKEWQKTNPELHKASVNSLDNLASNVWIEYCNYIRTCRRNLGLSLEVFLD